ncbi:MAG: FAD-dependent oxidoreductase [Candidatus Binataceae bacterium]
MPRKISRRKFIAASAAAAAATMLDGARLVRAASQGIASAQSVDVAIIGAGISGLVTARELGKTGVNSVLVLEARDRVGGRTLNSPIPGGSVVESGGQWIAPNHLEIYALAKELGIATFDTYDTGQTVFFLGGQHVVGDAGLDAAGGASSKALVEAVGKLEALTRTVVLEAPWKTPDAVALDRQTLAEWISANLKDPTASFLLGNVLATSLYGNPANLSLLFTMFQAKSLGGIAEQISVKGGDEQMRFVGGSQLLSLKMAQQLGDRVILDAPVKSISNWDRGPVAIEVGSRRITAKQVVIAMMPADNRRITFEPALPPMRAGLIRKSVAGVGTKFNIVYERPFWRARGLSGQSMSDTPTLITTLDNSPPSGKPGVLVGFTQGAWPAGTPVEPRASVAAALAKVFGPEALKPIDYVTINWGAQHWNAGCTTPMPPELLTHYGPAMWPSVGRITWAGAESSPISYGNMNGAVRAGIHAAQEVKHKL